jgi:Leucine-rich repeat (LRR) protein
MSDRFNLDLFRQSNVFKHSINAKELTDEVYSADDVYISILPIDLPDKTLSYRKDLEKKWLEVLPRLDNIKSLAIRLKANQAFFEVVCQMKNLESLFVVTSTTTNISSLSKLDKLNRLHLGSFSQLTDISPLQNLDNIKILSISNSFKIENYEILGKMKNLVALGLYGDEASPKNLRLKSLKPYASLQKLRHLDLKVTTVIDKSYETLLEMKNLERFDTFATLNKDLRDKVKSHPKLKAGFFVDWDWDNNCFYPDKNW